MIVFFSLVGIGLLAGLMAQVESLRREVRALRDAVEAQRGQ